MPTPTGLPTDRPTAPVLGGDAWVMPYEPGGPAWITATAPAIRVVDRRTRATATAR